jgi:hypothetical protein
MKQPNVSVSKTTLLILKNLLLCTDAKYCVSTILITGITPTHT